MDNKKLEKVVKGLECCLSSKYPPCDECGYDGDMKYNDPWSCRLSLMSDTLALLKAQEPVRPVLFVMDETKTNGVDFICSNCKGDFFHHHVSFCPWCGKAVKWNE